MQFLRKLIEKIKKPRRLFLIIFFSSFAAIVAATVFIIALAPEQGVWHYILYGVSALCLAYSVYLAAAFAAPAIKGKIVGLLSRHPFTNGILENYGFRTIIFATIGFIVNIAYAVLQAVMGIVTHSVWNITIAAFYLALIVMKGAVLFNERKHKDDTVRQIKIHRICGYMFNLLVFVISGIIILIHKSDMTFKYADTMIFIVAIYTFYKIISSIVQIFKARKQDCFYVQTIRNVNLVSALYSILVLQVAMFQAFGDSPKHFSNGITGGVIAAVIFAVSVLMIVKANRSLKQNKEIINEN